MHKISIVPRGRALGYTLNLPEEDRYLKTREELIDYMTVLLGGRASEEIVFGAITTGASDDLSRVAEISRSMIHDYAMGTSITSRKVSAEGGQVSDRTRQMRDEEQQHLADEAMRMAVRLINEHERRVVAFHEAGHALCAELLTGVNRVHKISIVPRGQALGYTLNLPEEDRYLKTREELIDFMTMLLGGRAAEQIVFGAITTGASDDLARVAEISRSMIHDYAMGTTITSRRVSAEGGLVSDRTRELRDEEQQHLSDEAMRGAVKLILDHRQKLDELAVELLENEVLERDDIERIMSGIPRFHRSPGQGLRVVAIEAPKEDSA